MEQTVENLMSMGLGLQISVVLATSEYGTPRPTISVRAPERSPHRRLSAALHLVVALVELETVPYERWGAYAEVGGNDTGRVYLELFDGSDAEASRGMEVMRLVIERLGWT